MSETSYSKTICRHCGGKIEYPQESAGQTVQCPHCGEQTILGNEVKLTLTAKLLIVVWILMVFGGGAAMVIFQPWKVEKTVSPTNSAPQDASTRREEWPVMNGFRVGPVEVKKGQGSGLVHAIGTLKNDNPNQRFGVRVELELLNEQGGSVGGASDYIDVMEPGAIWNFRALVTEPAAMSVKIKNITEQQ